MACCTGFVYIIMSYIKALVTYHSVLQFKVADFNLEYTGYQTFQTRF